MPKCFSCQENISGATYHPGCLRKLFGHSWQPEIPYKISDLPAEIAKTQGKMSISGVQVKASCRVDSSTKSIKIVGAGGTHILKPEPREYPQLPYCENLCMNMASAMKFSVPPHGLLFMKDNTPCYIVSRFDRTPDGNKHHVEDMAQVLEYHTEQKYECSLEKIGKAILKNTANPGLEAIDFFERALLSFIIGNGDMHLKNWAFLIQRDGKKALTPCYDFVSSKIYLPADADSALTINGRRNKLSRSDFDSLANSLEIVPPSLKNTYKKFRTSHDRISQLINSSLLDQERRDKLYQLIEDRYARLELSV